MACFLQLHSVHAAFFIKSFFFFGHSLDSAVYIAAVTDDDPAGIAITPKPHCKRRRKP
jgi:hypothetical protein